MELSRYRVRFEGRPDLSSASFADYRGDVAEGQVLEVQDEGEWQVVEIVRGEDGERDLIVLKPVAVE